MHGTRLHVIFNMESERSSRYIAGVVESSFRAVVSSESRKNGSSDPVFQSLFVDCALLG